LAIPWLYVLLTTFGKRHYRSHQQNRQSIQVSRVGSIFTIFFSKVPVTDYETATKADTELYARFFHQMLSLGIYLPPSQFEAIFISMAHTNDDIQATVDAANKALSSLRQQNTAVWQK